MPSTALPLLPWQGCEATVCVDQFTLVGVSNGLGCLWGEGTFG